VSFSFMIRRVRYKYLCVLFFEKNQIFNEIRLFFKEKFAYSNFFYYLCSVKNTHMIE